MVEPAVAKVTAKATISRTLSCQLLSGTYSVADIKLGSHGNSGSYQLTDIPVDATGVTFQGAGNDADIEARVYHWTENTLLGLVNWTTP